MNKIKLYLLLSVGCVAGYIWLAIVYLNGIHREIGVCLFKHVTGVPCPSCGSTRSILALVQGDLSGSLFWNPFGLILMAIMLISPVWILADVIRRKSTLFNFYNSAELFLKQKRVAIPAVLLVTGNWAWNIYKGL